MNGDFTWDAYLSASFPPGLTDTSYELKNVVLSDLSQTNASIFVQSTDITNIKTFGMEGGFEKLTFNPVPEPSTAALTLLGIAGAIAARRKRCRSSSHQGFRS
jgi:hypothetical protein